MGLLILPQERYFWESSDHLKISRNNRDVELNRQPWECSASLPTVECSSGQWNRMKSTRSFCEEKGNRLDPETIQITVKLYLIVSPCPISWVLLRRYLRWKWHWTTICFIFKKNASPTKRRSRKVDQRFTVDESISSVRADFLNSVQLFPPGYHFYCYRRKFRPVSLLEEGVDLKTMFSYTIDLFWETSLRVE